MFLKLDPIQLNSIVAAQLYWGNKKLKRSAKKAPSFPKKALNDNDKPR